AERTAGGGREALAFLDLRPLVFLHRLDFLRRRRSDDGHLDLALDGIHLGELDFDLVTRLDRFAGVAQLAAGKVGDVDEAVDARLEFDEGAEFGEGLDGAGGLAAHAEALAHGVPRVRLELAQPQAEAAGGGIDFEQQRLDGVALFHQLAGVLELAGPTHLGDVDEPFQARLEFDEGAEIGERGDLALDARALREAFGHAVPGVGLALLEAEVELALLGVELEDDHFDFLAGLEHFAGVLDLAP